MLEEFFAIDHKNVSVKEFKVVETSIQHIRPFVEKWHYSQNVAGLRISHCFALIHKSEMIGAMIYGNVAMPGAWMRYAEKEKDLLELRRLCCIDDTPSNTESYFIGKTLKWLKKNTDYKVIVSYADTMHGHEGTIYKASNFEHYGICPPTKMLKYKGKLYHSKVNNNYKYKYGKKFLDDDGNPVLRDDCRKFREAIENGEATWVKTCNKHIYLYHLNPKDFAGINRSGTNDCADD